MSNTTIVGIILLVIYLLDGLILIFFQGANDLNKAYDKAMEDYLKGCEKNEEDSIHSNN